MAQPNKRKWIVLCTKHNPCLFVRPTSSLQIKRPSLSSSALLLPSGPDCKHPLRQEVTEWKNQIITFGAIGFDTGELMVFIQREHTFVVHSHPVEKFCNVALIHGFLFFPFCISFHLFFLHSITSPIHPPRHQKT